MARCACCREPSFRLRTFFDGVCDQCLKGMAKHFEEVAADRAESFYPETWSCDLVTREEQHEKRGKPEWIKASFRMRDQRIIAERHADEWREIVLGKTAARIVRAEIDDYGNKRIRAFNARPNRTRARPYEERKAREYQAE